MGCEKEQKGEWDDLTLTVGKAIASGKPVDLPKLGSLGTFGHAQRLSELRKRFPMAYFVVPDIVAEDAKDYGDQLREEAEYFRNGFTSGIMFHQAMDRFKDHLHLTKKPGTEEPTGPRSSGLQLRRFTKAALCRFLDVHSHPVED